MKTRKRVISGDRPTGPLHLGHLVGTLETRVRLQDDYECFVIIADLQVFTDHLKNYPSIKGNVVEVMYDYLAVGLDPNKTTFFVQSGVPELAELTTYLSFFVPLPRLQRNPTVRSEAKAYGAKITYGFLGYPVSQAADILGINADFVPVGRDQLPHIELARDIARSFNRIFRSVFTSPQALVGKVPILVGTDGRKMSKSLDNHIAFAHSPEETERRILGMPTDPKRPYLTDRGHPDECLVFTYECIFFPGDAPAVRQECESAGRGCKECKKQLAEQLNKYLTEIRQRRQNYASQPDFVWDILADGTRRAREIVGETLDEVREAMGISYPELSRRRIVNAN